MASHGQPPLIYYLHMCLGTFLFFPCCYCYCRPPPSSKKEQHPWCGGSCSFLFSLDPCFCPTVPSSQQRWSSSISIPGFFRHTVYTVCFTTITRVQQISRLCVFCFQCVHSSGGCSRSLRRFSPSRRDPAAYGHHGHKQQIVTFPSFRGTFPLRNTGSWNGVILNMMM